MSDFDDEEYEEFDLSGRAAARGKAVGRDDRATVTATGPNEGDDSGDEDVEDDEDDDLDEDDLDEDELDDDDDVEDATEEDIDFVLAAYREDGQPVVSALATELANDLEELVAQLRRLPADAGSLGFVGLVEEVFVIARVRGQHVQVLISDGTAANDWPIARDVADLLSLEIPDPDDDPEPMGDMDLLADLGVRELDLGAIVDDLDLDSEQMLTAVADKLTMGPQVRRALEAAYGE